MTEGADDPRGRVRRSGPIKAPLPPAPTPTNAPTATTGRRPDGMPDQPLSPVGYGIAAVITLVIGLGSLVLFSLAVQRLGLDRSPGSFYLVLIVYGLVCALVLFGLMRSFASLIHQRAGVVLELGGPVVVAVLVIVGGYWFSATGRVPLTVTVRPYEAGTNMPITSSGIVALAVGDRQERQPVDAEGQATFRALPRELLGDSVQVSVQIEGYQPRAARVPLEGNVARIALEKVRDTVLHVSGTLVPAPPSGKTVRILIKAGDSVFTTTTQSAEFSVSVLGKVGQLVDVSLEVEGARVLNSYERLGRHWELPFAPGSPSAAPPRAPR